MPNYVRNKITFRTDFNQDSMKELLSFVLRDKEALEDETGEAANATKENALTLEERCRKDTLGFDFNALIPMPAELNIEAGSESDLSLLLYKAYKNLPMTLAQRIAQATIVEDIFCYDTDLCQRQYNIIRELIGLIGGNLTLVENTMRKLDSFFREVPDSLGYLIAHHSGFCRPGLSEINYFYGVGDQRSLSYQLIASQLTARMKRELGIENFTPLSIVDYLNTESGKRLFSMGEQCYMNIQKYGYADWYAWRYANWGTKWNAGRTSIDWDNRTISFETAWSMPEPIMRALHKQFPTVEFEWRYADEDFGYNTGVAVCKNGTLEIQAYENRSHEAYQTYVDLWGVHRCIYQDEDGEWNHYDCDSCPHSCHEEDL